MKVGALVAQASRNKENVRSCMGKNYNVIVIVICLPTELLPLLVALIDHSRNTITYHNALCLSPQNFA